jgi:hypothetical protein
MYFRLQPEELIESPCKVFRRNNDKSERYHRMYMKRRRERERERERERREESSERRKI